MKASLLTSRGISLGLIAGLLTLTLVPSPAATADGRRKLVLIAGKPSHPPLMHEFRAGTLLLEKCLAEVPGLVVEQHSDGWVADETTFEDADAVVIYADGGGKHPAVQGDHLATLQKLVDRGVGFACMHYGVEVVPEQAGKQFLSWLGGFYEGGYSCNPIWSPTFNELPSHPVTRGVKPFTIEDEWYINMRFQPAWGEGVDAEKAEGTTFVPILVAKPSDATRDGPYVYPKGPYPHVQAEKGHREAVMWTVERPDGGRGFGFTGGHFHLNWGNDDFRRTVLNALVWVAKAEVPEGGVNSAVTEVELHQNLDDKPQPKKKAAQAQPVPRVFQRMASR
ncbi:MAG: ThuA domain-containing protein [Verrucomicrobiales bacterium]|nr:ThuA domain-containing protein [Verrucomicrobiales bacterium]